MEPEHPTDPAHESDGSDPTVPTGRDEANGPPGADAGDGPDLDHLGRRLADVEAALERLDAGTYWTDEVTGEPIPDHVLDADPLARRAST